jgi:hypothetical protein
LLQESILQSDSEKSAFQNRWVVFKDKNILTCILIFSLAWFTNALTYYGVSFNMKNVDGNPYLNVFLLGALDYPAELSGLYFSNRFGRKKSFIGFLILSVGCLIIVAVDYGPETKIGGGNSDPFEVMFFCTREVPRESFGR